MAESPDIIVVPDDSQEEVLVLPPSPATWRCPICTLCNSLLASHCAACAAPSGPVPSALPGVRPRGGTSTASPAPTYPAFSAEPLTWLSGATGRLAAVLRAPTGQAAGVQSRLLASRLCCSQVAFFSQAEVGSGWACGWRCQQMVLSQLLAQPALRPALFDGSGRPPSIAALQAALEWAWGQGHDPLGREQLGGRVAGSRKFIGAGEAAALLHSLGVPAQWLSFHSFDDPNLEALLGGMQQPQLLARVRAARGVAEQVRANADPAQQTLHAALGLAPPKAAPPQWHSCRAHNFDACAACYSGRGGSSSSSSSGAAGVAGVGVCSAGCRLSPSSGTAEQHLRRECDVCGRGEESKRHRGDGSGSGSGGRAPDTPQERFYAHARHSALLRWIGATWGGPLAGRGGGGSAGSASSSASGSGGGGSASSASSATPPFCCYLQHDGHSRVLIGYELTEGAGGGLRGPAAAAGAQALASQPHLPRPSEHLALYILDPGVPEQDMDRALSGGHSWAPLVKRGLHTLRNAHYEVVWVPRPEEWGKYRLSKDLTPTRYFE
jgi:hypothetical protein